MEKSMTNIKSNLKDIRKVIDADNMKIIATFNVNNADKEIAYYKSLGKWDDVSIDRGGDIVLWKE